MQQYTYAPAEFLSQAQADVKVGNRVSAFKGEYTAERLAAFYAKDARDEHYRRARSQGCTATRSLTEGVYYLDITSGEC